MANRLLTGAEILDDAAGLALWKERNRLWRLDERYVEGTVAPEDVQYRAQSNLRDRFVAMLDWKP